jgi:hypothetical protein
MMLSDDIFLVIERVIGRWQLGWMRVGHGDFNKVQRAGVVYLMMRWHQLFKRYVDLMICTQSVACLRDSRPFASDIRISHAKHLNIPCDSFETVRNHCLITSDRIGNSSGRSSSSTSASYAIADTTTRQNHCLDMSAPSSTPANLPFHTTDLQ